MTVRGGRKLRAFLRRAEQPLPVHSIEIGFKGHIVGVAIGHEFGIPSVNLPERPAFRAGIPRMRAVYESRKAELVRKHLDGTLTLADMQDFALELRDALRQSYLEFHGAPLGERQKQRKRGTPYVDKLLVGAEGPKLVEHIKAFVDGAEVS